MLKNINDYIHVVKNAISNELCDEILNEYKNDNDWTDAVIGKGKVVKDVRNCQAIAISLPSIIDKKKSIRFKLDQDLFNGAAKCIAEYNLKFPDCNIEEDSGYDLLKYEENGFYKQHVDSFKAVPRSVSCSFMLNNDFEGGEFAFFNKELKYKLEKGDALLFPSNFMYPHEVMPVTKGVRYSIITWFI